LLHSEFEIRTQRLLLAILLFICCTRNFDYTAEKWKTDELQIKISNGLLTYCISAESRLYIISVNSAWTADWNPSAIYFNCFVW
jgi:hypothetical protein